MTTAPNGRLPSWVLIARALVLMVVGAGMLAHEALSFNPPRLFILGAGLLCCGFSVRDLTSLWRRDDE